MRRWGWIAAARLVSWNCVPMAQAFVLSFTHENCILLIYIYETAHTYKGTHAVTRFKTETKTRYTI